MQLLLIHSDFIEYSVKKRTPVAEDISDARKTGRLEDALAVFIAVEKDDEIDTPDSINQAIEEINKVAEQINVKNIMIYPYAHLSSNLSSPAVAVQVLEAIESELFNYVVIRAPFGWYKAFTISCKGHPLSELSRTIRHTGGETEGTTCGEAVSVTSANANTKVEVVSEALKQEEKAKSYWHILTPDGQLHDVEGFDFAGNDIDGGLQKLVNYEISKNRIVEAAPPHVELMQRLEIANYEEGSDSGNMRFYPKGRLIKSLLEEFVLRESNNAGAMEVETPIMYDMNHPTLKKYLDRFPARQYSIESDKRQLFLRFAACFGQFLMNHDMTISYKNLPLKMIELTRYSFRREQRGELVGLRRLRAFTMPDMHTLCADMPAAIEQFGEQYDMCIDTLAKTGIDIPDYEVAIRFTRDFFEDNKDFITGLAKRVGKPVLIEMWDTRFFYFVLKFEFNYIDALEKASALSTVQIDVENAERYDINYITSEGVRARPTILHCSPSGAIERIIYALLEKNAMLTDAGGVPMMPVWLSPTQVRIIPVSEKHLEYALQLAERFKNVRVDVDDRNETLGKRIRYAGREWTPYVVVVGDGEIESGNLAVTVRSESEPKKPHKVNMTVEELQARIDAEVGDMPYKPLPLSKLLSKRPIFIGAA